MKAEDVTEKLARLEAALQLRLQGRIRDFRIRQLANGLILQGRAASYHAKQLAQQAVMAETALLIVGNEIEVQPCQ